MVRCFWITFLLYAVPGPGVFGEERYVKAGANTTLSCPSRENVINLFWRYCDSCDNDVEADYIVTNSERIMSYPNINRIGFIFDTVNGVYSLILINFNGSTDAGKYFCEVDTGSSTIFRDYFEVELAEGPTTVSITGNSPVFADGPTSQLTLTCTATAIPAVTFEWRNRGDITGGGTSTLTLSPVQTSDNGANITCTAMNSEYNDIRTSHSVTLTVYYGPDSAVVTGDSTVYADGINTLTFTCTHDSVYPGVSFQWRKDGTSIGDNSDTLIFTPVPADDGKGVVCTATNTQHPDGQARGNMTLTLYYGPTSVSIDGNEPVYANDTNMLILTCTATQYSPGVGFQWREGNMNITGKNTNTYTKIANKSDNGRNLTCLTWNSMYPDKTKEALAQVIVYYAPSSGPVITGYSDNQTLIENDTTEPTVTLSCTVTGGFPEPSLTWSDECYDNGHTATSLVTSPVLITRSINQKKCTCAATQSNTPWKVQSHVTFTVHFGPDSVQITTGDDVLVENNNTDITCTTTEANPTKTITWHNGTEVVTVNSEYNLQPGENSGTRTSQTWRKELSWFDDKSVINCATTNQLNITISDNIQLDVQYGAKDTSIEVTQNTSEGDDVTVTCSCHSNPDPTFTITGPKSTLKNSSSRLEIRNISRFDGGEYNCTAGNKYFTETKTTTVTVKYPPDVSVTYGNTTETDTGATITCTAAGIPHSYNFYPWKHLAPDGETVIRELRGNHTEGQYTLTFRDSVTYEDSGYYRCTVNNGITGLSPHLNQTEMSGYFIVEGPPKILEKEDTIHGELGDEVDIEMQFYSVPEYTSVKWYILNGSHMTDTHNYNTIQATSETTFHGQSVNVSGYITTLKLDSVTANDLISYRVVVNNTKGSSSFVKTLKGITGPCTPGNETFKVLDEHSIKISWSAGCNGGTKQTFHIEYKKTTNTEWTQFRTIEENENNEIYSVKISDLEPGTKYDIRILARNAKGQSGYILLSSATADEETSTPLGGIIGGVAGGLVAILICIIVVVLFMRRRRLSTKEKKSDVETSRSYGSRNRLYQDEESTENPMYETAGVSAEPELELDPDPLYNQVKIVNDLPARKDVHSRDKNRDGDAYEIVSLKSENDKDALVDGARGGKNYHKNTAFNGSNKTKELRNADGLLYADLAFAKRTRRGPPIIHGLENTTDYASIDFTRRAPAPPQEDVVENATAEEETQN